MNKLKSLLGSMAAAVYFIFPMALVILMLLFTPLMFPTDVSAITASGFAGPNTAISITGVCGLSIGLSLIIPSLRQMYRALPWLYPFIKIFFIDLLILNTGITILNYGYQIHSEARHTLFYILMIIQIVVCRIAMCIYFKRRSAGNIEER